jgi:hypothetical protein
MIVKIFSARNTDDLQEQIQTWLDEKESDAADGGGELQIISVTQSEDDELITITIIAK